LERQLLHANFRQAEDCVPFLPAVGRLQRRNPLGTGQHVPHLDTGALHLQTRIDGHFYNSLQYLVLRRRQTGEAAIVRSLETTKYKALSVGVQRHRRACFQPALGFLLKFVAQPWYWRNRRQDRSRASWKRALRLRPADWK